MPLPKVEIPPLTFIRPPRTGNPEVDNHVHSVHTRFGGYAAWEHLIRETAAVCNISLMQLGMLVGLPNYPKVYDWVACRQRPSPVYAQRIHELALLESKYPGKVFWMKSINWYTGEITWKPE